MPTDPADNQLVFRALADPTRRSLLDALFVADGQTLGQLCARVPEMTRFGVGKHVALLEQAGLVTTARVGRTKQHFLNPVPVAQVADRWISKYAARFTAALLDLDRTISHRPSGGAMPEHVYQIYIAATPEQVWQAITDSDWTERYFHGTRYDRTPRLGPFRTHLVATGDGAVDGEILELVPPTADGPGRFVLTWHVLYDEALGAEPPGRVAWTVSAAGDGLTLVRLVHDGLERSPLTSAEVQDGWVWVLDSLKTVLETGTALPRVARAS
jgi:uncharacterized protein YndB with AHSA1/START domain/DNA-binding transcriptional ArsR family regulator